jgi:hypothetical protein
MLIGEAFGQWRTDGSGTEQVVCALCEEDAERKGWVQVEGGLTRQTTASTTWHARKVA